MKNSRNENLKLGVFVIIGLFVFIVAIYFIGDQKNMFARTFTISSNFNNVNGLLKGNNVRYSGINVGNVKSISMINDSTINVSMAIQEKMVEHIKKDAIATIGTDGLVGNMIVNIIPGDGDSRPIEPDDVIKSYTKIGTSDMLNTLNVTNENAALLTAELLDIANSISKGEGTLGMLINDSITSNNIKTSIYHLKLTTIEANRAMKEINSLMNSIDFDNSVAGALLNDSTEARNVKEMITNLNQSSEDIKLIVHNLDETITEIKDGNGALNYLTQDEEFVKNLEQSIININEGTDKFNQNMEALKHNFLIRGYFRKLERQKEREARRAERETP